MYESPSQKTPTFEAKGIETVSFLLIISEFFGLDFFTFIQPKAKRTKKRVVGSKGSMQTNSEGSP